MTSARTMEQYALFTSCPQSAEHSCQQFYCTPLINIRWRRRGNPLAKMWKKDSKLANMHVDHERFEILLKKLAMQKMQLLMQQIWEASNKCLDEKLHQIRKVTFTQWLWEEVIWVV